jgi:hypothetical protein
MVGGERQKTPKSHEAILCYGTYLYLVKGTAIFETADGLCIVAKPMMQPTARNCRTTADPGSEVNASNGSLGGEVCRFYGKYLFNISKSNNSGTGGQAY